MLLKNTHTHKQTTHLLAVYFYHTPSPHACPSWVISFVLRIWSLGVSCTDQGWGATSLTSIRLTFNDLENSDMRSFRSCESPPFLSRKMPVLLHPEVDLWSSVPRTFSQVCSQNYSCFPFPMTHLMFSLGLSKVILGFVYMYVHVYMSECLCSGVYMSVCGNKKILGVVSWIYHGLLLTWDSRLINQQAQKFAHLQLYSWNWKYFPLFLALLNAF